MIPKYLESQAMPPDRLSVLARLANVSSMAKYAILNQ
jgi:hypothetical protein